MKKAVYLGNAGTIASVYAPELREQMRNRFDFPTETVLGREDLAAQGETLRETELIFSTWGMPALSREEIRTWLPHVQAVFYGAGSVQGFARPFLEEGVTVVSAWAANGVPVAEYTFAQITLAAKGFFQRLHRPGTGADWINKNPGVAFPGSYQVRVGIIGAGMIGRMVIERLHTLGKAEILVFDPFLSEEAAHTLGVRKTSLEEIFSSCDVISNHLANNPQTVGMLRGDLFAAMQPHTVFINTGRGAQVDEAGMIAALQDVPTRTAVLDVTWPEPPDADSPLYTMDNVFLTPHIAGSLGREVHRMAEYMYEEACAFEEGRPLRYAVTRPMLDTMA